MDLLIPEAFDHITLAKLVVCLTILYFWAKERWLKRTRSCQIVQTTSYQSTSPLFRAPFPSHPGLSFDNTIFLTGVCSDGWSLYTWHILYAILQYYRQDLTNLYFLAIAVLLLYEYADDKCIPHVVAVIIFLTAFVVGHIYSLIDCIREQNKINCAPVKKLIHRNTMQTQTVMQKDLRRGDFIYVGRNLTEIPADLLLLSQLSTFSPLYAQEIKLTGENRLIKKEPLYPGDENSSVTIEHHKSRGTLHDIVYSQMDNIAYSDKNVLFRGTHTQIQQEDTSLFGLVIETGNDCHIYRMKHTRERGQTKLQKTIVQHCFWNLYLMLLLDCFTGLIVFADSDGLTYWQAIRRMIIFFNTFVPLSLQFFFEHGSRILSRCLEDEHHVKINRHGTMSFQVDPKFVVTDKTGTLTTGKMTFQGVVAFDSKLQAFIWDSSFKDIVPAFDVANILSLTEITSEVHTDELEFLMIESLLGSKNIIQNLPNSVTYKHQATTIQLQRLFYRPFHHDIGGKLAVVRAFDGSLVLHYQGKTENAARLAHTDESGLNSLFQEDIPEDACVRLLGHICCTIDSNTLKWLYNNTLLNFDQLESMWNTSSTNHPHFYIFFDFVVPDVHKSVCDLLETQHKRITMLTGDRFSTAREVGIKIGLTPDICSHITNVSELDRALTTSPNQAIFLSGSLLETLIEQGSSAQLNSLVTTRSRMVVYRATPKGKRLYVELLQRHGEVLMIGDDANDISALSRADLGIAICGNCSHVEQVADVTMQTWTQIPDYLRRCRDKTQKMDFINEVVLMKHVISGITLFVLFFLSHYEVTRDPAHFLLNTSLNGLMFCWMYLFLRKRVPNPPSQLNCTPPKLSKFLVARGVLFGLVNGSIVFSLVPVEQKEFGIILCIALQILELTVEIFRPRKELVPCSE